MYGKCTVPPYGAAMRALARFAAVAVLLASVTLSASPAHAAPSTRLLIVGDSISHGSASDYTWRYRLARHLSAVAPGTVDFVGDRTDVYDNINGRSGSQSYLDANFDRQHHALWGRAVSAEKETIAAAVASSDATTMTVLLGINDLAWLGQTPVGLAADMEQLIANARSANPDLDIVLGRVLTRGDLWRKVVINGAQVAEVNAWYSAIAGQLSTSRSRVVIANTDVGWDPVKHTWDGVHPNSTGEVRIAAKFADGLAQLGIGRAWGAIPDFVAWGAGGGLMTARPVTGGISLTWARTPGANAIYVEQRIVSIGEGNFKPLPVPLTGTTWTAKPLPAGWTIEYRAVPLKGVMVGHGGTVGRATVPGTPPVGTPQLVGVIGETQHDVRLLWSTVSNASGYMIEMCELRGELVCGSPGNSWTRLPYALPHPTNSFNVELLKPGTWYRFRIVPVNGGLDGTRSNLVDIRTKGTPAYTNYFALGDSFSAGTGGVFDLTYCLRSSFAWPHKITASWEAGARMLACAGDTALGVMNKQLPDVEAVDARGATLVTVTAGGNDADFFLTLVHCLTPGAVDCASREAAIANTINTTVKQNLLDLYRAIRQTLPGADIYAVGYPLLIDPDDVCLNGIELTLSYREKVMIRNLGRIMNDVIDDAARETGVISVAYKPAERFAGHGVCAGALDLDQWIHPFVTVMPQMTMHPNDRGYDAYAYAVNAARVNVAEAGGLRYPS
jgi:lysophospholipase L1-like esterase